MMQNVNITSVNVRGLNTYEKRNKFFTWVNQSKIDVLLLQETHFIEKNLKKNMILTGMVNRYTLFQTQLTVEVSLYFLEKN